MIGMFFFFAGWFLLPGIPSGSLVAQGPLEVIASGLDNPRGLDFGPEGALYVAEAGRGGEGPCIEGPEGGDVCLGQTGGITRIWRGAARRIVSHLPSLAGPGGGGAIGPHDISFQGRGNGYVVLGLGSHPGNRARLGPGGALLGRLARFAPSGHRALVADFVAIETRRNPDGGELDTNPYAVLAHPAGQIVADAGGNAVYGVLHPGWVFTLAVFPDQPQPSFPFPGFPMQAVPNALTFGPDGAIYVGQLTGFPFPPGGANVYRLIPGHAPRVFRSGFTNIIDLAFGRDGSLFVLQFAAAGLLNVPPGELPVSSIVRVQRDGTRTTLNTPGLLAATALTVGWDGALYVSNKGVLPGAGEVVRIVP
jgi:hypothetical protein